MIRLERVEWRFNGTGYVFAETVSSLGRLLDQTCFPGSLSFVPGLDMDLSSNVTFFVGENGSGKSTLLEAVAELCLLPAGGGGRNELADTQSYSRRSELAPFLGAAFSKKPANGYFFRAEHLVHFASLLEERQSDPDFREDPYSHYGGRSLHSRSHGEAFLASANGSRCRNAF